MGIQEHTSIIEPLRTSSHSVRSVRDRFPKPTVAIGQIELTQPEDITPP